MLIIDSNKTRVIEVDMLFFEEEEETNGKIIYCVYYIRKGKKVLFDIFGEEEKATNFILNAYNRNVSRQI
jgi:hypothetical protein